VWYQVNTTEDRPTHLRLNIFIIKKEYVLFLREFPLQPQTLSRLLRFEQTSGTKNKTTKVMDLGRFKLLNQIYSKFKKKSRFAQASEQ